MKAVALEVSWHAQQPVLSLDFHESGRLATAGADGDVKIWRIVRGRVAATAALAAAKAEAGPVTTPALPTTSAPASSTTTTTTTTTTSTSPSASGVAGTSQQQQPQVVEYLASLSRHEKTVNVVRFSPDGKILASGADDYSVLLWTHAPNRVPPAFSNDKECWSTTHILRGHVMDVYDLAWSPDSARLLSGSTDNTAIVWDVRSGKPLRHLKRHSGYVQGVAWDPRGDVYATQSCDRSLRVYPAGSMDAREIAVVSAMDHGLSFADDSAAGFFRRLDWTPDGSLLLVPAAQYTRANSTDDLAECAPTTLVFSRHDLVNPVMHLPGPDKTVVAVRACPVLFRLRPGCAPPLADLPYRMVFAVAALDVVFIYDTAQAVPIAVLRGLHYADITDVAWSHDGRLLAASSADGYCSVVLFDQGELGEPLSAAETNAVFHPADPTTAARSPVRGGAAAVVPSVSSASSSASPAPAVTVLTAKRCGVVESAVDTTPVSSPSPAATVPTSILKDRHRRRRRRRSDDDADGSDPGSDDSSVRVAKRVRFDAKASEAGHPRPVLLSKVSKAGKAGKRSARGVKSGKQRARALKVQQANAALSHDALSYENDAAADAAGDADEDATIPHLAPVVDDHDHDDDDAVEGKSHRVLDDSGPIRVASVRRVTPVSVTSS